MMHTIPYVNRFSASCHALWKEWNAPGLNRASRLKDAISAAVQPFMSVPDIEYRRMSRGNYGAFTASTWKFVCNDRYFVDNISWKNFKEVAGTLYHETRHAEQVYRVAQALHLQKIEMPSGGSDAPLIRMGAGGPPVRQVEHKRLKKRRFLFTTRRSAKDLRSVLGIPGNVATHAVENATNGTHGFDAFAGSDTIAWVDDTLFGTDPKWQLAAEEWLEEEHRSSRKQFLEAGEEGDTSNVTIFGNNARRDGVVEHLYFNALKCEVDSFQVEELVKKQLDVLNPIRPAVRRNTLAPIIV